MSGHNPYAVNGGSSKSNPYGANPYGGPTQYNDPYLTQSNASSASVNSYGSRDTRRRRDEPNRNPYEQRTPRGGSPTPPTNPYARPNRSPSPGQEDRLGYSQNSSSRGGGGYGGLGESLQDQERQRTSPARPSTANRDRVAGDSRSRERRGLSDARDAPPPPRSTAQASPFTNTSLQPVPNGNYPSSRQYSPRRPIKGMDEILKHIKTHWKIMEGDECVPVKVALQLADSSSLGLGEKEGDFADTHVDLQRCLKGVVNEHYADFNSAVGTYHKIQSSIKESQSRVRYLKSGLMNVKEGMLTTRPELRNLAEQSGELDSLLSILNQMETLREMPNRLEEKINEKRWLGAVEVLSEALRSCRKSELDSIGAISDLRSYFANQESSLVDMLIEELHDHLYLKSPYCIDRWKGRMANVNQQNSTQDFGGNIWDRPVYHFLASLDTKHPMNEDASKNPESDTFYYIHMTVEALNKLGYLEETVRRIEQRMPMELYRVVDRTNSEVDLKFPSHIRGQLEKSKRTLNVLHANEGRSQVLSEFLTTLYAKFEAIAEGHRVLHEVFYGIVDREKITKSETFVSGFKELWKLYQMEMRSLLHDYLATDTNVATSSGKIAAAGTDIFARHARDKNKKMFKLAEVDEKSSDIKAEEDELEEILKSSVPGLVTKSKTQAGMNGKTERGASDSTAAGHKLLIEPSVFNMTILLPPSLAFLQHLRDIVPQTSNIPMSTLTSFLDDFLINVFHPQLEEAVTELCTRSILDMEAFMEEPRWSNYSPHPIFKGTVAFLDLIKSFSGMLSSIPQDQLFTQLIVAQLIKYYDKCYGFYKGIVTRVAQAAPNSNSAVQTMKAAAKYADSGEIHDTTLDLWLLDDSDKPRSLELLLKEVQQLLAATKTSPVQAYDVISDPKSVHQLALIYNSMQWLSSSLLMLRHVENSSLSGKTHSRNTSATGNSNPRRWTLIGKIKTSSSGQPSDMARMYLPLNSETVVLFDETVSSFRELAQKSLFTLHIDIRCGVIHQLGRTLRPPETSNGSDQVSTASRDSSGLSQPPLESGLYPFVLPSPPTSASPRILELNNDLISFDANISSFLGIKERRFILSGLGRLVDRYLVVGADFVQVMNKEGAERMRVDGMVVQQVLRGLGVNSKLAIGERARQQNGSNTNGLGLGIAANKGTNSSADEEDDALLTSSSQYYELFLRGPDAIMDFVKQRKASQPPKDVGYSYDELRTLIELCFSASVRGSDREEALQARKRMGDLLLQLGEIMWDS